MTQPDILASADLTPADLGDLSAILAAANADRRTVAIVGGGSKADIGRPQRQTPTISTARLAGVVDYDPAELVLTVRAGEKLAAIEALLAASNQMLAFDPFDFGPVFERPTGASTIGGVVGAGLAGSRRLSAGNVRDHVLGFTAVSGTGEVFNAGGRVVKNVTGYDVSKLMAGSWGRLAVMTQMTLKVLPRPRTVLTLALRGLSARAGAQAMAMALRSQGEVAAAAFAGDPSLTALRLEGSAPSVEARARLLTDLLGDLGAVVRLEEAEAGAFWPAVRNGTLFGQGAADDVVWRISGPISAGASVAEAIAGLGGRALLDWAGALVWARTPAAVIAPVRALAEAMGGHAMLVRASPEVRRDHPALHPEAPGVVALSARIKAAFDPNGVLDPHRFTGATR